MNWFRERSCGHTLSRRNLFLLVWNMELCSSLSSLIHTVTISWLIFTLAWMSGLSVGGNLARKGQNSLSTRYTAHHFAFLCFYSTTVQGKATSIIYPPSPSAQCAVRSSHVCDIRLLQQKLMWYKIFRIVMISAQDSMSEEGGLEGFRWKRITANVRVCQE